jgi:hypothetical protein
MLTVPILPPPHIWPSWYVKRASYTYWLLRNNSSVHSIAVTCSYEELVLTASSSSSSATSSPFLILPWERVSWTFLGCHYASFPTRSLGCLVLLFNSPLSVFGHLSRGPASCLAIRRNIWSKWTQAWWPPLSLFSFECLWPMSRGPASCLTAQEPSDKSRHDPDSLPWLAAKLTLNVFLGQFTYSMHHGNWAL